MFQFNRGRFAAPRVVRAVPRVVTPAARIPAMEMADVAVKRVLGADPKSWKGTFYVHCSGKTGEVLLLAGSVPGLRKLLPAAKIGIVTMGHYRYAVDQLSPEFKFDTFVELPMLPGMQLAKSVERHNGDFRQGHVAYRDGVIVNCYRGHAWHVYDRAWPKGAFYHSFAEGVGIVRTEWKKPVWGEQLSDRFGDIALALATLNMHSSHRRKIPFTPQQWQQLAEVLRQRGLKPVATGHKDDGSVEMPGWEWIDGGLDTPLGLIRESQFTIGGNSGMMFLAAGYSRGPLVMLDEGWQGPMLHVSYMQDLIPDGRMTQFQLDKMGRNDAAAFNTVLSAATGLPIRSEAS